jgi:peptidoglycan/LPS O-acetylase OafA/YrhL
VLVEARAYSKPRDFFINRALRIFPLYYLVAALTLLALTIMGSGNHSVGAFQEMPLSARFVVGLSNLTLLGQDQVMFMSVSDGILFWSGDFKSGEVPLYQALLVPQAWTLSLELMFYLIAPWLLTSKRKILVVFALSVLVRGLFVILGFGLEEPWDYRFFPTELAFFLFGAISHQIIAPNLSRLRSLSKPSFLAIPTLTMSALIVFYPQVHLPEGFKFVLLFGGLGILMPLLFDFQTKNRLDNFLGQLSYPIYLWHILVTNVFRVATEGLNLSPALDLMGVLVFTVGISWLGLKVVEDPIQKIRARFRASGKKHLEDN